MNVGPTDIDATARSAVAVVASYIGRSGKYRQLFQPGRSCPYSCHNPFHMQFFFLVGPLFLWRATVFFFTLFIHSNTSIWMVDAVGSSFMHYYCYTIYLNKSNKHQPVELKKIRVWVCAVQCTGTVHIRDALHPYGLLFRNYLMGIVRHLSVFKHIWASMFWLMKRLSYHIMHSRTYEFKSALMNSVFAKLSLFLSLFWILILPTLLSFSLSLTASLITSTFIRIPSFFLAVVLFLIFIRFLFARVKY